MRGKMIITAGLAVAAAGLAAGFPMIGKSGWPFFQPLEEGLVRLPGGPVRLGSPEAGPDNPPHFVTLPAFAIGAREVTAAEYADYLNRTGAANAPRGAGIVGRPGRWRAAFGRGRRPVTGVSLAEAEAYCRWRGAICGRRLRLPTEAEWEYAARGGVHGARYPWGWGDPFGRAVLATREPARAGRFPPNGFGLYDMAGNVFEWCRPADDAPPDRAPARGGSWAERDPRLLRVFHRAWFPRDYRDADVGFRIAMDL